MYYLGVDIGGTFTDLVLMDDSGTISTAKALTTPGHLEDGVFDAIALAAKNSGMTPEELLGRVESFGHGTTQATNALIERDGAITGLITTRGFGDTLSLQRLMGFTAGLSVDQLGWYSRRRYPQPIIPRNLVREVSERVDQAGNVLVALDETVTEQAVKELVGLGVETFAVALLWSFRNTDHERRIGKIIRDICPDAYVSLSHEVAPVIGEYERMATTGMNSYLSTKVVSYLQSVENLLRDKGFNGAFYILNSSGGVIPAHEAAKKPVLLVASGPTGGVMGSLQLAKELNLENIITTDMGGTSFDVAIIVDGKPLVSGSHETGGFHLSTPMVDITAIGSGGGSIASVVNGKLQVGPKSAGARPGPVCYGQGGTLATVTDADVVLGIISPDNFLGGRMKLDLEGATNAIRKQVAEPLRISVEEAAAGIRRVVDSQMADTLREVTIGRGYDPRDFTLFAYGGAGPAHCAGFGVELGVSRIVIPATSMAHSAYGALASDIQQTAEQSFLIQGGGGDLQLWEGIDPEQVSTIFKELKNRALDDIEKAGIARGEAELSCTIDMRYRRQTHDLMISVPNGEITAADVQDFVARFETTYETVYGKGAGFRQAGIALSTFRVAAVGRKKKPTLRGPEISVVPTASERKVFEPATNASATASVWDWLTLPRDYRIDGPAIIEHPETTVYVATGQTALIDSIGNLSIDLSGVQS